MIRRGELKTNDGIGYDEWRECHNPTCKARFRPVQTVDGTSTEFHCSSECAAACLERRLYGLGNVKQLTTNDEEK